MSLPAGTVTFLFSDIEGSTRLLTQLGDGYADVLIRHRDALRRAFDQHGGVEVGTEGDSFFVAFTRASDAVAAAVAGQAALAATGEVRVRMGIHTGEPTIVADDYVGIDVHHAARICSAAHGGQVVLSERTASMVGDKFDLRDLGVHRLKDLAEGQRLFQVGPGKFPPLRSLNQSNLPVQTSPLIGRDREVAEVTRLLLDHRVVTVTGPGGTGKTRLALQVAADLVDEFEGGVHWVPLAQVSDAALVLPSMSVALGAEAPPAETIGVKHVLLVLDNAEQVVSAALDLAQLVSACPNLHLLVTSRSPLRIAAESEYRLDPLSDQDAGILFRERAPVKATDDVVAAICARLDGLPLAIELAAARLRMFSPEQLLTRLDQRLPLLTSGPRDAPERQRTLRSAIEWSYDLLTPEAQRLFARLAVFAGSFDLDGAEHVAECGFEVLESLVEDSLVRHRDGRFWMLETIRELAVGKLEESGEAGHLRRRHAEHYCAVTQAANQNSAAWTATSAKRLQLERDNVVAAIAWATELRDAELAWKLWAAVEWSQLGWIPQGISLIRRVLPLLEDHTRRTRALRAFGHLLNISNETDEAISVLTETADLCRATGDLASAVRAGIQLGHALRARDLIAARDAFFGAVALMRDLPPDLALEAGVRHGMGEVLRDLGEYEAAERELLRGIAVTTELRGRKFAHVTVHSLADLELDRGRLAEAESLYLEALAGSSAAGLTRMSRYCVAGLAAVAAKRDEREQAARLWRAVEAHEESSFWAAAFERGRYTAVIDPVMASAECAPTASLDEVIAELLESYRPFA